MIVYTLWNGEYWICRVTPSCLIFEIPESIDPGEDFIQLQKDFKGLIIGDPVYIKSSKLFTVCVEPENVKKFLVIYEKWMP